ncbi:hypothetical protein EDD21DRAFT_367014 [Dissophora ornata]|nr:hypothetical protein EDD21DRAFT_367014 [Dissophora ornata]
MYLFSPRGFSFLLFVSCRTMFKETSPPPPGAQYPQWPYPALIHEYLRFLANNLSVLIIIYIPVLREGGREVQQQSG